MKSFLVIIIVTFCTMLHLNSAGLEQGTEPGFYFTPRAGAAWSQDLSFRDDVGTGRLKFDPGARLEVGGAYRFAERAAMELYQAVGKPEEASECSRNLTEFRP